MESLIRAMELVRDLYADGFVTAIAVSIVAPLLGTLLVLWRMPMLALALPEVAGAGVAFAYWVFPFLGIEAVIASGIEQPPLWSQHLGAATTMLLGLAALAYFGRDGQHTALHAVLAYVLSTSVAEVFLIESEFHEFSETWLHHGRLLTILPEGRQHVLWVCLAALVLNILWRRGLLLAAFDPDLARLAGRSPNLALLRTMLLVGGFCVLVVPEVGPDVVLVLLLVPAIVVRRGARSLPMYVTLSITSGVLGTLGAYAFAVLRDWPLGAALAVAVTLVSVAVRLTAPHLPRSTTREVRHSVPSP